MNKNRIREIINPYKEFVHNEAFGGILLLTVTVIALVLSNSSIGEGFLHFWHNDVTIGFAGYLVHFSLLHAINDGLMVLFFLVVGLEIKRELLVGELSKFKNAILPIIAAIGGIVFPAIIYLSFNSGKAGADGWAVPVATDIAFVVGILILLKNRIPQSLRVFLTALAIVDDIGAVIIIALFYTSTISINALIAAGGIILLLVFANSIQIKSLAVYLTLGFFLWLAFLFSGIHTTVAGVILAFIIPSKSKMNFSSFTNSIKGLVQKIERLVDNDGKADVEKKLSIIHTMEKNCEESLTPLQRLEHSLHPWITYFIIPLFALSNAGVAISGNFTKYLLDPVGLGIVLGLFFGKQIGIFLFTILSVKLKIAAMPMGATNIQIYGASILAGIGFTMSLFIAGLSFTGNAELMDTARIGILAASAISGIIGFIILRFK